MNERQKDAIKKLQGRLRSDRNVTATLPDRGEADGGYAFTEVEGVTVVIGPRGGYIVPAVRTYHMDALDAAVEAHVLWDEQKERDDADTLTARNWDRGAP